MNHNAVETTSRTLLHIQLTIHVNNEKIQIFYIHTHKFNNS